MENKTYLKPPTSFTVQFERPVSRPTRTIFIIFSVSAVDWVILGQIWHGFQGFKGLGQLCQKSPNCNKQNSDNFAMITHKLSFAMPWWDRCNQKGAKKTHDQRIPSKKRVFRQMFHRLPESKSSKMEGLIPIVQYLFMLFLEPLMFFLMVKPALLLVEPPLLLLEHVRTSCSVVVKATCLLVKT